MNNLKDFSKLIICVLLEFNRELRAERGEAPAAGPHREQPAGSGRGRYTERLRCRRPDPLLSKLH